MNKTLWQNKKKNKNKFIWQKSAGKKISRNLASSFLFFFLLHLSPLSFFVFFSPEILHFTVTSVSLFLSFFIFIFINYYLISFEDSLSSTFERRFGIVHRSINFGNKSIQKFLSLGWFASLALRLRVALFQNWITGGEREREKKFLRFGSLSVL